jgi:glycosyltransferase involved in cell wall biosynthesis
MPARLPPNQLKLSVIIPCRNNATTIGSQLEAIGTQRWVGGFEVIVVDNQSTDTSVAIASKYRNMITGLRIIAARERSGAGYARNAGVRASTGDAILFCDADDEVALGWLSAMGHALCEYDFVACRIELDKLNEPRIVASRGGTQTDGLQRLPYPPYLPHAGAGTLGVKRWLHDAVGGFDESFRYVEDAHYCLRIQLAGHGLHFVPSASVNVRLRVSLCQIFRQARNYGLYSVRLYKASRALGTERLPHPWRPGMLAWRALLQSLPALRIARTRPSLIFQLGYRTGRLLGSVKHLTIAP